MNIIRLSNYDLALLYIALMDRARKYGDCGCDVWQKRADELAEEIATAQKCKHEAVLITTPISE